MNAINPSQKGGARAARNGNSSHPATFLRRANPRNAAREESVSLPLTKKAFEGAENSDATAHGMVWQSGGAGPMDHILIGNPDLCVLIVNDHPAMRSLIRSVLLSYGILNVQETVGGIEGLDCIRRHKPNIAIVATDMASMNGVEFVRHVRGDRISPNPSVPILMTTDALCQRQILEIRDAGVIDIIVTPFSTYTLARRIVSLLEEERDFIRSATYCGPDRRRHETSFHGSDRRYHIDTLPDLPTQHENEDVFWV